MPPVYLQYLYRKYLLNRLTASPRFLTVAENFLSKDLAELKQCFHKIMVHNWQTNGEELFATLQECYSTDFIPIKYVVEDDFCSFYTDAIELILKIIRADFLFSFKRNMFNIDILFNDKSSTDLWGTATTIESIVCGVISQRFSEKCELNLEDILNDPELKEKKLHLLQIKQLEKYQDLLTMIGRETKVLNLRKNNLEQLPMELMKYFIKGDLTGLNLGDNNIKSIAELPRISSKIERLWLEGNPLCENEDPMSYVKVVCVKFPRLKELDGVPINEHGFVYPFWRNFLITPTAKMLTEKFLTLYFTHYDSMPRKGIADFYDDKAQYSLSTSFDAAQHEHLKHYMNFSRNLLAPTEKNFVRSVVKKPYNTRAAIAGILNIMPETVHDPNSFTVDVLQHDKNTTIMVVEGVYKERPRSLNQPDLFFHFRRTFVFENFKHTYLIRNELCHVSLASQDNIHNCFKNPIRNLNSLSLLQPEKDQTQTIAIAFAHLTQLKMNEVIVRLKIHSWDIRKALNSFTDEFQNNMIPSDKFEGSTNLDDLTDDEID